MPHLNELHEKYGERGLVIIGVSDEDEGKIQSVFVEERGAKYPIVKINGGDVSNYGIKFYPSYYCIDPEGAVFSVPDDRMPSDAQIEELLANVQLAPKLPDGSQYDSLRKYWEKRDYAKLRDHIDKTLENGDLEADVKEVFTAQKTSLDKLVQSQQKRVEKLAAGPDYYASTLSLRKIERDWKGFEVADVAKKELARMNSDSQIKKEIAASKAFEKLCSRYDRNSQSQAKKLAKAIPGFLKRYEGTYAATQAQKLLEK
ncbi:MAG: TlpA family protein disulfide reductase [Planctomycetes bacterium]|nr:TlpA family protein disulfide reductase [Planctomycetota bacterium]MCB9890674.1 TlpA family protein disulfide reductase [Planctomycetota bacterium]MCB9920103.1 TlpA family protein disulfide reductase [Planctomycetota bacterium]